MAFDAGMLASSICEIKRTALGARIEKVYQPSNDELIIQMRSFEGGKKLLINAGGNNPRIGFTELSRENPQSPPMFCMLMRKYLNGAKLTNIYQSGFERAAFLEFETRDEMGFAATRNLIVEVMGKYSNLIYTDENLKVIAVMKPVDFTTSSRRQVLPGMKYELPPKQDKKDPLTETEAGFLKSAAELGIDRPADKFLSGTYLGISASLAREAAYRVSGKTDVPVSECDVKKLWQEFSSIINMIKNNKYSPSVVLTKDSLSPVEYGFFTLTQYSSDDFEVRSIESPGKVLDIYYDGRDRETRVKQYASDLFRILGNAQTRIAKKLELQRAELAECEKGEEYKRRGDLITANIYLLKRGMKKASLVDYSSQNPDGSFAEVEIELDERLSPAANAQRFYKKYNKSKSAKVALAGQIALGESEETYIQSVFDSLSRAETPSDLSEIREELYRSGYASKMKSYVRAKNVKPAFSEYRTSGGYRVICGKNNIQNEQITFGIAEKNDYWFHAKNVPGSHVLLVTKGEEPPAEDFTEAAEIAALNSKAEGENIAVDYTLAKNIKKPPASKPGFVIYHTNWTAYVTPNKETVEKLKIK